MLHQLRKLIGFMGGRGDEQRNLEIVGEGGGNLLDLSLPLRHEKGDFFPPPKMEKIYVCDRVGMIDQEGQLIFGFVIISPRTSTVRIQWDDGDNDKLRKVEVGDTINTREIQGGGGTGVGVKHRIGIFDRKCVGLGSKVLNKDRTLVGSVREKRFLTTLVVENTNWRTVIKDIPCEDLMKVGHDRAHEKVLWHDEWIGVTTNMETAISFAIDKDGREGYYVDDGENFGGVYPRPGEKIRNLAVSHLWGAKWFPGSSRGWWILDFFKNLGQSATITDAKIHTVSLDWMGHIDPEEGVPLPPKELKKEEDIQNLQFLEGRHWAYLKDFERWAYRLKGTETVMPYTKWVQQMYNKTFVGGQGDEEDQQELDTIFMGWDEHHEGVLTLEGLLEKGKGEEGGQGDADKNTLVYVRIGAWRSVVDVDWEDGSFTTGTPSSDVFPVLAEEDDFPDYLCGDIVYDLRDPPSISHKYGIIIDTQLEEEGNNYLDPSKVLVRWILPDPTDAMREPKILGETVEHIDSLDLHKAYRYLKGIQHLPVVVPKDPTAHLDVKAAVVVGMDYHHNKVIIRYPPGGQEKRVWAHQFSHYKNDRMYEPIKNNWVPWDDKVICGDDVPKPPILPKEEKEEKDDATTKTPPILLARKVSSTMLIRTTR